MFECVRIGSQSIETRIDFAVVVAVVNVDDADVSVSVDLLVQQLFRFQSILLSRIHTTLCAEVFGWNVFFCITLLSFV